MTRIAGMCSLEILQNVDMNDKVVIIADTRHTQRWSERKVDPMLCAGDLAFLEGLRLWAHERSPGIQRNVEDLKSAELADVLGAIVEDRHLTRCAENIQQYLFLPTALPTYKALL